MPELNKVVAHFGDGTVVHGTTLDFFPNRPVFHLNPIEGGKPIQVRCSALKALFFVKNFTGNPQREDLRGFIAGPQETTHGKKIAVRFKDGEFLCGYALSYTPEREGFMVFPADTGSNNTRIYVITKSTVEVKAGPAADMMAQKSIDGLRAAG